MEYKVIAGSLTAHTNNDRTHLANYINKKQQIAKSLCEELILHDQINIPIQDYLTACGLFIILGESGFISLLESNQIRFLSYRGQIVFAKARHRDGSLAISAPVEPHPWSSPDDVSIGISFDFLESNFNIKNRRKLEALLLKQTDSVNINHCLESIRGNTERPSERPRTQTYIVRWEVGHCTLPLNILPCIERVSGRSAVNTGPLDTLQRRTIRYNR